MPDKSMIGKEEELLSFMKDNGFPVFHQSNIFFRDVEYGIRDYYRVNLKKDIGMRESAKLADEFVKALEQKNIFQPLTPNTWLLNMPQFLNQPKETPPTPEKK